MDLAEIERPIGVAFPSLRRFEQGNCGVPYVFQFGSETPGPHVLLCALTHGNEVCGAIALAALLDANLLPQRGTLTVAFNNIAAYEQFNPNVPDDARFVEEDFNRVWSDTRLYAPANSVERTRALQLLPFVRKADYLLDLHSMHEPCVPIWICGIQAKNEALARSVRNDTLAPPSPTRIRGLQR